MPTNLYGPKDNFSENESHVIPGLIKRMHSAKMQNQRNFLIWGSGNPKREFLFSEDLADAIDFIIQNDISTQIINIGSGKEITIKDLAKIIKTTVGFDGDLAFDSTKPDGNPRKLLDSSKIFKLGWSPKTELISGIDITYKWFCENYN